MTRVKKEQRQDYFSQQSILLTVLAYISPGFTIVIPILGCTFP